jgi:CRP-like cAMP-binding protein
MSFRNRLLNEFSALGIPGLTSQLVKTTLNRGQVLFEPGALPDGVFFPGTAVLSVVTMMSDGRSAESSTIGFESSAPLLSALVATPIESRIFTQIGGDAYRISSAWLRNVASQSPKLMTLLLRHVRATIRQTEQGVACNSFHDAPARLARWILMTADRTGSERLPLTQEYLAVMVGVQRTTITAAAGDLRDRGIIRFKRGVLEIADRAALERSSCECYDPLRETFLSLAAPQAGAARA